MQIVLAVPYELHLRITDYVSIPDHSIWDQWWTKWRWNRFCSEYFGSPLSYLSTKAPYYIHTLLLTEGQKAKPGNLPKCKDLSEIVELRTERYCHLVLKESFRFENYEHTQLTLILVNNQLDAPFSMYLFIYFTLRVSSNTMLIIRRIELY